MHKNGLLGEKKWSQKYGVDYGEDLKRSIGATLTSTERENNDSGMHARYW